MNFYKRYPGDYQRDTGHLTMIQHGAYTLLLDVAYATGNPLPKDKKTLYRLTRAFEEEEQKAVDFVLSEFWKSTQKGWVNNRVKKEVESANEYSRLQSEKGRKGGRPKKATALPEHKPKKSRSLAEKKPSHSHSYGNGERLPNGRSPHSPTAEEIDAWWDNQKHLGKRPESMEEEP